MVARAVAGDHPRHHEMTFNVTYKSNHCTRYDHCTLIQHMLKVSVSFSVHRLTLAIATVSRCKQEACQSRHLTHLFSDHQRHIQCKSSAVNQLARWGFLMASSSLVAIWTGGDILVKH